MDRPTRYRQLAEHYLHAIRSGVLAEGERMPSVRTLMGRHGVSLSTALQACRELEKEGVLDARPRAGYFVRAQPARPLPPASEPALALADPARYVGMHHRVSDILARGQQASVRLNLASAFAAPAHYPGEALRASTARALRAHPDAFCQPPPRLGDAGFRRVLAARALASRMRLTPDEIVVTHGCTEALNLALRAVTRPGDIVAVESPTYFGLLQVLESLGLRALEIPTSPHTGLSLEALQLAGEAYPDIAAVAVVPNFQNPLGSVMPDAHKAALVAWCAARSIPLIEDDTYAPLTRDDTPLAALKTWDTDGNVIHCASLSKVLAPGMRLGWLSGGRWHARIEMLKYAQSHPNEVLGQLAVADFMTGGGHDRHLRRLRTRLNRQREQLADGVARHFPAGTRLSVPDGGIAIWVELPDGLDATRLFESALAEGIRLAPGTLFSNSGRFDHYLRLSCGLPYTRELDLALRRLGVLAAARPDIRPDKA